VVAIQSLRDIVTWTSPVSGDQTLFTRGYARGRILRAKKRVVKVKSPELNITVVWLAREYPHESSTWCSNIVMLPCLNDRRLSLFFTKKKQ
jgi:hypothetical protein